MWTIFKTLFKKLLKLLPRRALTNIDLIKYAKLLKVPHFRGVFMRNELPKRIKKYETGIVNLDNDWGTGTHWTAYIKNNNNINYFDSFGNLRPPKELITYFLSDGSRNNITYNYDTYQSFNDSTCGHLSLQFIYNNM